jgi:hypothetical protein
LQRLQYEARNPLYRLDVGPHIDGHHYRLR